MYMYVCVLPADSYIFQVMRYYVISSFPVPLQQLSGVDSRSYPEYKVIEFQGRVEQLERELQRFVLLIPWHVWCTENLYC